MEQIKNHIVNDEEILQLLRKNAERGFSLLVKTYQERLYWHIRRMVKEHNDTHDVLQNTFVKIFRSIHKFQGKSALYTWLYRIATNESITFINKRKRKSAASLDDEANTVYQLRSDPFFDGDEVQLKLKQAVDKLPEKQQLVFNMRYYEEMSYKEISEVLGTSVGGLKASYHHAVKKIEAFFKES